MCSRIVNLHVFLEKGTSLPLKECRGVKTGCSGKVVCFSFSCLARCTVNCTVVNVVAVSVPPEVSWRHRRP